jgi:hypothetical protein
MKVVLTTVILIALVLDLALFFGIGAGVGALTTAPSGQLHNSCLGNTIDQDGSSESQIAFCVYFSLPSGDQFVSDYGPGGVSTPITFAIDNVNNVYGACDQDAGLWDTWLTGPGATHGAYAEVQILDGSTGQPINLGAQSTNSFQTPGVVSQSAYAWTISYNNSSPQSAFCGKGAGALPGNQTVWVNTFAVTGALDDFSIVQVTFYTTGAMCETDAFLPQTAACAVSGPGGEQVGTGTPRGTWNAVSISQAYLRLGGAKVTWNGQTLYNGQSFTVPVTTYYDQGQGFHVQFLYPAARGGSEIATITAPDDQPGFQANFKVPSNAAVNASDPTYNWFQIVVTNPITQYVYINQPIDISPLYAPPAPDVKVTDLTSAGGSTQVGDQISVQVYAQGIPAQKEKITSIYFWAWYLEPGASASTLPPVGSTAWISQGGQQGQPLQTVTSDYNATASTNYTIGAPYTVEMQVESVTNTAQTSRAATSISIYVKPPGCTGPSCNTHPGGNAFWEAAGPALLSVAIVLAAMLLALYIPTPYIRYGIVAVGVGFVIACYVFGFYGNWFGTGGLLNAGAGG